MMQNSEWEVHPGTAEIQHVPCLHTVAVLSSVYSHCLFSGQRVSVPRGILPSEGRHASSLDSGQAGPGKRGG